MARRAGTSHAGSKQGAARRRIKASVVQLVELAPVAGVDRSEITDMVRTTWTRDAIGRPPVEPDKRKSKLVQVRVTAAEHDKLVRAAKRAGVSVSTLMRRVARRVARSK